MLIRAINSKSSRVSQADKASWFSSRFKTSLRQSFSDNVFLDIRPTTSSTRSCLNLQTTNSVSLECQQYTVWSTRRWRLPGFRWNPGTVLYSLRPDAPLSGRLRPKLTEPRQSRVSAHSGDDHPLRLAHRTGNPAHARTLGVRPASERPGALRHRLATAQGSSLAQP
jgi:hypothetical protein